MEPTPLNPWLWLAPTAVVGTVGLVAVARHKRKRSEKTAERGSRDPRSYWQQRSIASNERTAQVEALARMVASEAGTQPDELKRLIAWMARNRANWLHRPLAQLGAPRGDWGPIAVDRPFATDQPATAIERTLASAVLDQPQARDPSNGATHGFHRGMQNQLAHRGHVQHDGDAIHQIWTRQFHLQPILEIGPWTFYRSSNKR